MPSSVEPALKPTWIFEKMREDHARVLAEIAALESAVSVLEGDGAPRESLEGALTGITRLLELQFSTHMAAEDEILFPALARALPGTLGSIEPLRTEHEELRSMLRALRQLLESPAGKARDEQIAVQVRDLVDLLRIHIRKEEAVVFRVAERVLEPRQLESLADRMTGSAQPPDAKPGGPSKGNPK
jgi:hemerythrin-like domain-containing protein